MPSSPSTSSRCSPTRGSTSPTAAYSAATRPLSRLPCRASPVLTSATSFTRAGPTRKPDCCIVTGPAVVGHICVPPRGLGCATSLCRMAEVRTLRSTSGARWTGGEDAGAVLADEARPARPVAQADLPSGGRGTGARAPARCRDHREQPRLVLGLDLHAVGGAAEGHLRGQGRVLHRYGHQGLPRPDVLHRGRH